jgi:hypothetical protein
MCGMNHHHRSDAIFLGFSSDNPKPYFFDMLALARELEDQVESDARWMREMLTDYKVPFDDHAVGRRLALNGFIHALMAKIKAPDGEWRLGGREAISGSLTPADLQSKFPDGPGPHQQFQP